MNSSIVRRINEVLKKQGQLLIPAIDADCLLGTAYIVNRNDRLKVLTKQVNIEKLAEQLHV
jgi:hypothetical protein